MAGERLLFIDDDVLHLQLLQQLFAGEGYVIDCARNAEEAVAALEANVPDLILLDLILPDVDGYTLLETIKANPAWRFIPVIIISSKQGVEDKLRGLRLGVMDYITKPFEREELRAKVRNLLDFFRQKMQQRQEEKTSSQQRLLDHMKSHGIRNLVPQVCRDAKLGYVYPEAAEILQPEEVGAEIFILESMARDRLLERVFYDVIHICPHCGHHDLNFREVCPNCEYADIYQKKMITHLGCGHRAEAEAFRNDGEIRCPQCGDALHRKGEDFEVTPTATHVCRGCKETFSDPIVNCRCMNCDARFDVVSALLRRVYSYKLISSSEEEDLPDPVEGIDPGDAAPLPEWFLSGSPKNLAYEDFLKELERELSRAHGTGLPVSLLGLHFPSEGFDEDLIATQGAYLLRQLQEILRPYDRITLRSLWHWIVLLPETPYRIARILAERVDAVVGNMAFEAPVELTLAGYPEDGRSAEELLEVLRLGLVRL